MSTVRIIVMLALVPLWAAASGVRAQAEEPHGIMTLGVAGGITDRKIEIHASDGPRQVDTGWVPAVALRWRGAIEHGKAMYALTVHYETSLHAIGEQHPPSRTSQALTTPIRSHRFEAGITPSLRFGEDYAGVSLGLFLGYGLRALASVTELEVPRFTLHGPLARIALEVPIVPHVLRLHIGPEIWAIVSMSRALRRLGETNTFGLSVGGDARLRLRIANQLDAQLEYREAHAFANSTRADEFRDVERFVLVGVGLQF